MGSIYEGICAGFMKLKKSWETPLLLPILDAYHLRGILGGFHENEKSFGKHAKISLLRCLPHERYPSPENIFCKTPSQNPVFAAISEGVLILSMQLDKFIIIHLLHSPPPEPGGHAPWPFYASDNHGPSMPVCYRQGDDGRAGQWYFSKELGGSAGVKLPWTRFAVGHQMNPARTGARSNRYAKI